ncbi:helicase-associated domain-containing protein [Corynebacterium falsenii]
MVPTRAATALADTLDRVRAGDCPDPVADLAERLESVLPAPVDTLIIQADHTIMAPGLLSADDAAMLARIADQESAGMASVWRVSKESLLRALGGGASADEILEFLQSKAMGGASGVPQSLSYLIADAQRALAEGAATPTRRAFGGDGMDDMAAVLVEAPRRAWQGPDAESLAELDRTIDAAVEAFRRSVADIQDGLGGAGGPGGAGGAGSPQVVTDLRGMMSALKNAYASGTIVELAYANRQGEPVHDRVSVVMMSPSVIAVVSEISGESFTLQPHRLTSVANA